MLNDGLLSHPFSPDLFNIYMVGNKTKRINNSFMTIFDILKLWQEHPTLCRTMARLLTVSIIQFREDSTYSFAYLSARCIIPKR